MKKLFEIGDEILVNGEWFIVEEFNEMEWNIVASDEDGGEFDIQPEAVEDQKKGS